MDEEKMLQWKQIIETCEESGLPVKRWCKENQISSPSYYYWKKRIFPANEVSTNDTAFVEVPFEPVQEEKMHVISLDVKWNAMQFQISSKEEADLAAYLIGKLHYL